jgi:NTE family protein
VGRFADLVLLGRGNPVLLAPEIRLDLFWLSAGPVVSRISLSKTFMVATNDLDRNKIPRGAVETGCSRSDGHSRVVSSSLISDKLLIDSGAINPLPYDLLFGLADIIVAVDVTFGSRSPKRRTPSPVASMFGAARVIQGTITAQENARHPCTAKAFRCT